MGKLFGYHTLGVLLKSLSDSCFRADEQEKRGEKVTACGMSSDEIEDLCENYLPYGSQPTDDCRAGEEGSSYQRIYSKKGYR